MSMHINILFFGELAEITAQSKTVLNDIENTEKLTHLLEDMYPALKHTKYMLVLDKQTIIENTMLTNNCTVALLPAFSGG